LIKAKAKAERAAARQASQAPLVAAMLISAPASMSTPPVEEGSAPEAGSVELQTQDGEDPEPNPMPKETAPDRTELLRSKSAVVGRFMQLMVPILIDVYAASVITPVRVKTLTGLLKAVSFLDADGLKRVLTVRGNLCL
jgi:E3 ubiquitin-protein ligase TRIP12